MEIKDVIILGGGSAGFMAAVTLKRKLPQLNIRVIRSPDIDVIGQGVPHAKPYTLAAAEQKAWDNYQRTWRQAAQNAFTVKEALAVFRGPKMRWE